MRNPGPFLTSTMIAMALATFRNFAQSREPYTFVTIAGLAGANRGNADGTGSAARFSASLGVAVDGAGNLYAADSGNGAIRKLTSAGVVTTLAGQAGTFGSRDGTGNVARFWNPTGVAVDNVCVADTCNKTIRKVTPAGVLTTLAGGSYGSADGMGSAARFAAARSLALDAAANIYVADTGNYTIRKVTPSGTNWAVTTLAGLSGKPGNTAWRGTVLETSMWRTNSTIRSGK